MYAKNLKRIAEKRFKMLIEISSHQQHPEC